MKKCKKKMKVKWSDESNKCLTDKDILTKNLGKKRAEHIRTAIVIPKEYTPVIDLSYYDISDVIKAEYEPYLNLTNEILNVLEINIKHKTLVFAGGKEANNIFNLILKDWRKKHKVLEENVNQIVNEYKGIKK